MDPFWQRVEELFDSALQQPEAEREAWLASQTGFDRELREEVLSLVAADRRNRELSAAAEDDDAAAQPEAGLHFGPYRTERLLGRGGIGAVYLAHRDDGQFDQTVALKVMAAHLAGEEFERCFRNERQLQASLAHPNIARLLHGGVSANGDPYLVMEYVEGQPLNRYCDDRKLTVQARIRLFLQVCDAMEFAHRNLILHGDLKPANILVTKDGTAKLLDLGIARLARDPEGKVSQFAVLTPQYASPEQIRGEIVNTLSDVFSLGVIFYEMLVGAWPFGDPLATADGIERVLRGGGATAPAQAVSDAAAALRSATRERLRRQLEGDLSTILLKMLDSEPARRYGSVREVREDLERFRQGCPVHARPRSAWHAARKFAARNRLAVLVTGLSVIALVSLTVISAYESVEARAQAARAQRISEFAKNTFLSVGSFWGSPLHEKRDAIQFTAILDNAAGRLGRELGNDPAAEADLRDTLGFTYAMLGETAKGEAQLLLGLKTLARIPGGSPGMAGNLYLHLCDTLSYQGRYAEALAACRQCLALWRVTNRNGLGGALHDTAFMAVNAGEALPEAEKLYREAIPFRPAGEPFAGAHAAIMKSRIGMLRLRQGDLDGGERVLIEADAVLRSHGDPLTEIIPVLYARAFGADVRGRYPQAAALMSEALDLAIRRHVAFMQPDELALQLAAYEALAGNPGALARLRAVEGRLDSGTVAPVDRIRHNLYAGVVEARFGSKVAAENHLRSALATRETEMSRQPDLSVEICVRLMRLLRASGREREAAEAARRGLSAAELAYGSYFAGHPFVIELRQSLR
jgi:eukaryotic-like serine/threonine-protein kinase